MSNVSMLYEEPQKALIEDIQMCIAAYSLKETIDCLIEAIEIDQEELPDESERRKDLDLIKGFIEAVSSAAEDLSEDAKTELGCRQMRRRARDNFLIAISDVKVM